MRVQEAEQIRAREGGRRRLFGPATTRVGRTDGFQTVQPQGAATE